MPENKRDSPLVPFPEASSANQRIVSEGKRRKFYSFESFPATPIFLATRFETAVC